MLFSPHLRDFSYRAISLEIPLSKNSEVKLCYAVSRSAIVGLVDNNGLVFVSNSLFYLCTSEILSQFWPYVCTNLHHFSVKNQITTHSLNVLYCSMSSSILHLHCCRTCSSSSIVPLASLFFLYHCSSCIIVSLSSLFLLHHCSFHSVAPVIPHFSLYQSVLILAYFHLPT